MLIFAVLLAGSFVGGHVLRAFAQESCARGDQTYRVVSGDTLGGIARVLRFFMGIPGGSKQEGVRLLEQAIAQGMLTTNTARFYLALNLHRYDQQYEKALNILGPLAEKYPGNPLFQLARGDLYAKLGRKQQAAACYRAASALPVQDGECRSHIQELVRASVAALGAE